MVLVVAKNDHNEGVIALVDVSRLLSETPTTLRQKQFVNDIKNATVVVEAVTFNNNNYRLSEDGGYYTI